MAEEVQTQPEATPAQQPAAVQADPAGAMEGETSIWKKWWLWLIIALVVIAIGAGIYFLI